MDNFEIRISTRKNKKYDVYKNGKFLVSFGDKRYAQYHDQLGVYSHLDHYDDQRRANYYKRFGKDAKYLSAKYFSHKYLW
jgi:hypothetical protein